MSKFFKNMEQSSGSGSEDDQEPKIVEEQQKEKKTKKKSKFQVQNSDEDEQEQQEEEKPQKNKKKSKFQVQNSDDEEQQEEEKPKKNKKKSKFQVQNSDDEEEQQQEEEEKPKKNKKKSKFQVQEEEEEEDPFKSDEDKKSKKKAKKDKKKSKFEVQEDNEEEEQQQEIKEEQQVQESKQENKKNKKKNKKKNIEDELDEDELLEQMARENQKLLEEQKQQEQENQGEEQEKDDGKPQEKTKAQLKREKKKLKEKQLKEQGGEQAEKKDEQEEESKASKSKAKKKGPKLNLAAQKAAEALAKKEEEERIHREKVEAAIRAEEERIRKIEEEEAEKKRLKEEQINQLKKEGKYLTKKQKREQEKLEIARQRLQLVQGGNNLLIQKQVSQQSQKSDVKEQKQEKQETKKQETKKEEVQQEKKEEKKVDQGDDDDVIDDWEAEEITSNGPKSKKNSDNDIKVQVNNASTTGKKKRKHSSDDEFEGIPKDEIYAKPKTQDGSVLRSPIICIMGHVDTGKTTLLDKLRRTNVQDKEAGGITQQIGATFFPGEKVKEQTEKCQKFYPTEVKAPGLLIIDTPGHESFANLRSRGSGLCDFAILVIDLMHGLEQQTIESIKMLTERKTPFVIALNKIDRCYDWKSKEFESSFTSLKRQKKNVYQDFETRYRKIVTQLAEIEKNAVLYWDNKDIKSFFPIVPTSGVTGEGIPDLLSVIIKYTSFFMKSKMMVKQDEFNCTVMECKTIEGHGATIDGILVDGVLRRGDTVTLLGFQGPITTKIRALLTPQPMKETRVKGDYIAHDVIYASMGIKIAAKGLEEAVAGSQLLLTNDEASVAEAREIVGRDLENVKKQIKLSDHGVGVAASTLGSLEALLSFLKVEKIPVSYVTVGPVSKDDITKAMKALLSDEPQNRKKEFAVMLVFDIKVLKEAQEYAETQGVKIFTAQIIYHLQNEYVKYKNQCIEERRIQHQRDAVFPCQLKVLKVFRANKPMLVGVKVERGQLRIGCPVVAYNSEMDDYPMVGTVESMESNGKPVKGNKATKETGDIAIKIKEHGNAKGGFTFKEDDHLISKISRYSIDCLKEHFRDEVAKDDWKLIKDKLKPLFNIV